MKLSSPISIVLIACLGILAYSNTFSCSFHFDDAHFILNNPYIRNIHDLQNIWIWFPSRFITLFSFALNYHLNQFNVFGYHLFNLAVHIASAILVWWLVLLTFSSPVMKEEKIAQHADLVSLFAGLIFVSHPIQTESVTFIWQRAASMAALFCLASVSFYVRSRLLQNKESNICYIFSLITALMAMFTKENTIVLPLMILLYEFSFFRTKRALNWKSLVPFLFTLLVIPVTWLLSQSERVFAKDTFIVHISSMQYFLTEFRVLCTYIRLLFLPLHQNLDYDYSLSKSIFELPTLFSFIFLIGILVLAKRMFSKYRLISFSIFWFFLTLLPESSFFPFADVIFEHRLYLPMVGYSIFLVSSVYYLFGKNSIKTMVIVLTMIVACNAVLTYQRNKVWQDDLTLWSDTAAKSPHKARPRNFLAYAYASRGALYGEGGNLTQAIADFTKAIEINPKDAGGYYNRAGTYYQLKEYDRAWADVHQAEELGYAVSPGFITGLKEASGGPK